MLTLGALFLPALLAMATPRATAPPAPAPAAAPVSKATPAPALKVTGRVAGATRAQLAETTVELVLHSGRQGAATATRTAGSAPLAAAPGPPPPPVTAKPLPDGSFALAAAEAGLYRIRISTPG